MNILDLKRKLLPMSGYQMGGGGSGGGGSTTSTSYQTNIPEYAREYVENMLMATQKQIYKPGTGTPQYEDVPVYEDRFVSTGGYGAGKMEKVQTGTERKLISGSETPSGDPDSFQGYKAYGGTYAKPGQVMTDPSGRTIIEAATGKPRTYEGGEQISYDPGKGIAGFQPAQLAAQKAITDMYTPGEFGAGASLAVKAGAGSLASAGDAMRYGAQGQQSGLMGQDIGTQGGAYYGDMGAGYGAQGAMYGARSADVGQMGLRAEQYGRNVSGQAEDYARQAAGAGQQYARQATSPGATQAYMSPYMQSVVNIQQREAQTQADIAKTQRNAQAVGAGAYGGSRQAIMDAEAARNLATQKGDIQAQGLQSAYQQAQQAQQFGAGLGLQGLQGAQQGLGTALQGGQLGLAGIGTTLQGLQGGMQGAGLGMQGAQTGLQGVDRRLAGTAQGMQGAQAGLQGVSGAQAGYGMASQAGSNLANIGAQRQANELALYGAQNAVGAQQQALEQQILNQAQQDYANEQQYPLMQLGTMSNMLRGLPMQAQTTQQYQAQPNPFTQAIGAAGTTASLYNAFNPPRPPGGAAGGLPSEFKYSKGGGIMSYDVGGEVESDLENMDEEGLQKQLKESSSPSVKRIAQRILRERQMSRQAQGTGPMGVQYQAPTMAGGGIIAFKESTEENNQSLVEEKPELTAGQILQQRVMQGKPVGDVTAQPQGIVQAAPTAPVPAPTFNQAVQGDVDLTPAMKAYQKESAATAAVPVEDIMARNQAARKAAGIEAPGIEQRARLMAERANAEDEAERTRNLRLAEFFASWGSTPGDTLTAGMLAFKNKVPDMISDEKEAKKIRMEIDKSLAALDEATRLEKVGNFDAATAEKNKAAEIAKAVNFEVIKIGQTEAEAVRKEGRDEKKDIRQGQREEAKDVRYATLQREITQMKIDSEEKMKSAVQEAAAAAKSDASANRLTTLYTNTSQDAANAEAKIQNTMKSTEYLDLVRDAAPSSKDLGPEALKIQQTAKTELDKMNQSFVDQRRVVNEARAFIAAQLKSKNIDVNPTTPAKKPKAGDRPGLDDPALQR